MPHRPTAPPDIVDPHTFATRGYPHEIWTRLRRDAPVAWCEHEDFAPFWAISRHEDVVAVARRTTDFANTARFAMVPDDAADLTKLPIRHLLNMNPPEHRDYRRVISSHFTRRAIGIRCERISALADEILGEIEDGQEIDFVDSIAAKLPLAVIAELLGLPREDRERFYRWTNQIVGCTDPEFAGGATHVLETALREQLDYFADLVRLRRREPRDDLTSVLAHARVGGKPIGEIELLSFLFLLVTAGNETTRNAISGGLLALLEWPRALAALRNDRSAIVPATEEILRWTSPIIHICREARRDLELRGIRIREGETVVMFYASANRDESVFEEPSSFRIERSPNPHLAFGTGEHFCLGSHLARLEIQAALAGLIRHFDSIEPTGPVARLRGSFVGGIKSMRVRVSRSASRAGVERVQS